MVVEVFVTVRNVGTCKVPCSNIQLFHKRNTAAGKLTFQYAQNNRFEMGSLVTLTVNQLPFFVGYVFSNTCTQQLSTVIAFDQMQYLLYKDSKIIENISISQFVLDIIKEKGLYQGPVEMSPYVISSKVFRQSTHLDMIHSCMADALLFHNQDFSLFDKEGQLHFQRCDNLLVPITLSDRHNIISCQIGQEIFSNTYNYLKVERKNKKTGTSDLFIRQDKRTQEVWGSLAYHHTVEEDATEGEINQYMHNFFLQKNWETNHIRITCLGDTRFYIGHVVRLEIHSMGIFKFYIIQESTHSFEGGKYICKLTLKDFVNNR